MGEGWLEIGASSCQRVRLVHDGHLNVGVGAAISIIISAAGLDRRILNGIRPECPVCGLAAKMNDDAIVGVLLGPIFL